MKPKSPNFYDRYKFDILFVTEQKRQGYPTYAVGVRKDENSICFSWIQEEGRNLLYENHLGNGEGVLRDS